MYEELIQSLKICAACELEECIPDCGRNEPDYDLVSVYNALEAMNARIAALRSEKAELQRRFDEVNDFEKSQCVKLLEKLSRMEAERDVARQDCAVAEENHRKALERQKELDDALRDMVCQYCSYDGKLDHEFMSAGEHAFDVLDLDYGAPVDTLWRGAQGEG